MSVCHDNDTCLLNEVGPSNGPLTQLVEYLPFKQRVTGSNPVRPTTYMSPSSSQVQDTGLSRRQHRFKSGRGRQVKSRG